MHGSLVLAVVVDGELVGANVVREAIGGGRQARLPPHAGQKRQLKQHNEYN